MHIDSRLIDIAASFPRHQVRLYVRIVPFQPLSLARGANGEPHLGQTNPKTHDSTSKEASHTLCSSPVR